MTRYRVMPAHCWWATWCIWDAQRGCWVQDFGGNPRTFTAGAAQVEAERLNAGRTSS